ncbi:DUF4330 family protein [Halobaculum sp. MBLA0147]|uniref:DUF4330 family protein n=1 Tax=Halobaculum sp. MBLA0147 TaxID=3079934 RepID=UPI003524733C
MPVIDERGRVLGVVNVVDLLVSTLVVALLASGVVVVTDGGAGASESVRQTVVVETGPHGTHVSEAITSGDVPTAEGISVQNVAVVNETDSGSTLHLTVSLRVRQTDDGLPQYRGERLVVDRTLRLDLGDVIVSGRVIDIVESSDE